MSNLNLTRENKHFNNKREYVNNKSTNFLTKDHFEYERVDGNIDFSEFNRYGRGAMTGYAKLSAPTLNASYARRRAVSCK